MTNGFFEPWECDALADRLTELISGWPHFGDEGRERAEQMVIGLRRASARDQRFLYL